MKFNFSQKGISLYLALMVMTALLAIALGMNTILVSQIKTIKGMENSVIAFYAADTGIEEILMNRSNPTSSCIESNPCFLDNGAEYYLVIITSGLDCGADNFCIKSIGQYKETQRAIEINY